MTRLGIALTVGLVALGTRLDAGAPARIDDDFVIRGCVTDANAPSVIAPASLVWSRSDIMLAAAEAREDAVPIAGRVFYWLEDDEDLSRYRGQRVEVRGELEDFEKGKVEIDRHDKYTKITLDLDGKKQEARVPNGWLNPASAKHDEEFQIVARRMDVKKVKVLGACVGGS